MGKKRKSTVINSERFEKIKESGRKERYRDRWTGQEVSRRFATQATTGMKIEERQRALRAEREAIREAKRERAKHVKTGIPLLESFLKEQGIATRGEDAEGFRQLKEDFKDIKRNNPDTWRSKWVDRLYEEYGRDTFDDFDFHAFFGSPTVE